MKIEQSQILLASKQNQELQAHSITLATDSSARQTSSGIELSLSRETAELLSFNAHSTIDSDQNSQHLTQAYVAHSLTSALTQATVSISRWQGNLQENRLGTQVEVHSIEQIKRSESLSFEALGSIQSSDGRHIDFVLQLDVQRQIKEEQSAYFNSKVTRTDPLMLNLNGGLVELTNQWFDFDLLGDGSNLGLLKTAQGSGYLAFDQNDNGLIDNGLELFGPQTNQGFAELSQYDEDQNGWIDENDSIFNQLGLYSFNEQGEAQFQRAKDIGLGALYLGHRAAQYDLLHQTGQVLGTLVNNGVALMENGQSLLLQEVHLAHNQSAAPTLPVAANVDALAAINTQLNVTPTPTNVRPATADTSALDVKQALKTMAFDLYSGYTKRSYGITPAAKAEPSLDPRIENLRAVIEKLRKMREAQQQLKGQLL